MAVQEAVAFIEEKLSALAFELTETLATDCLLSIRETLNAKAVLEGRALRDFACTFLGVISTQQGTLVLQIGDGGVVLDIGQGLEVPVVPMSGEYANMTHFVTDDNALSQLVTKSYPVIATRVAVFSDGLQRLALNMANNTAHEPFFTPFFKVLATATEEQEDQLNDALVKFLQSPAVNERTDDDKTLTLAVFMG